MYCRDAIKLLIGVREDDIESIERQVSNIVVVGDKLTSSLERLLCIRDPHYKIYAIGRQKFFVILNEDDYMSNTPLEAAYCWSLSCMPAVNGELRFINKIFCIKCNDLRDGRQFPKKLM